MSSQDNGRGKLARSDERFMRLAIAAMRRAGVTDKTGGPFGAVIVRDGQVLAACGNSVRRDNDPTAHAEINAIRQACATLGTYDLSGAILYTSCECCPMCYAAAYWARIDKIYYAASWRDYDDLFDDAAIHADMGRPPAERLLGPQQLLRDEALAVLKEFRLLPDGARY
jgi:tRNA(Arg) A34 adenosine deaminase TadA